MRIAYLGKRGSAKTTLSSLFISHIAKKYGSVLAVDADINAHLSGALSMASSHSCLGDQQHDIAAHVRGTRTDLGDMPLVATTPPSLDSRFIRPLSTDPVIMRHANTENGISLLTIGSYKIDDVGHTCYHGKLNTLEMMYHHMLDRDDEYVVADATAGVDNLGTSLFFAYDVNVCVVEPTEKSITVFKKFEEHARHFGLTTVVVANKVERGDEAFLRKELAGHTLLGSLPRLSCIRRFEQGDRLALDVLPPELYALCEALEQYCAHMNRNWDRYYDLLLSTHKKNSLEWWDDYFAKPIHAQHDPSFSYQKAFQRYAAS